MYFQIYIPYMIYVYATIYGLFKTVKMTFNTRKKMVYGGKKWRMEAHYAKHTCRTTLHFPLPCMFLL